MDARVRIARAGMIRWKVLEVDGKNGLIFSFWLCGSSSHPYHHKTDRKSGDGDPCKLPEGATELIAPHLQAEEDGVKSPAADLAPLVELMRPILERKLTLSA